MRSPLNSLRRARPLLGTLVDIRVDPGAGTDALQAAFGAVAKVHRLMSAQDPESDVGRINRASAGVNVPMHSWTRQVMRRARELFDATEGLFDCFTSGPERLTLDGIAKGFAVDQAVAVLRAAGAAWGTVNAGGDLRVFGMRAQAVQVRDAHGLLLPIGVLREEAIASSASASIVDPRNGRHCRAGDTVSVIAPDCMTADALTKAIAIDPATGKRALERLGARAIALPGLQRAA